MRFDLSSHFELTVQSFSSNLRGATHSLIDLIQCNEPEIDFC